MATIRPLAANIARDAIRHGLFTWFRHALCVPLYAREEEGSTKAAEPQLTLPLRLRPQVQALLRQDRQ